MARSRAGDPEDGGHVDLLVPDDDGRHEARGRLSQRRVPGPYNILCVWRDVIKIAPDCGDTSTAYLQTHKVYGTSTRIFT